MFQIKDCLMCNGFYSLNFNQPLCSTCHLFLFPASSNEGVETMEVRISYECIKSR